MHYLTTNAKLSKQSGVEYLISGLALAPHRRAGNGINTCPDAGACSAACNLWFSGRTVTETVRAAMLRRTRELFDDPIGFRELLADDLTRFASKAARRQLAPLVRLNIASDLDWSDIAEQFPQITFYDYCKVRSRVARMRAGDWPNNYELTYSVNERSHHRTVGAQLRAGFNVSVVFDTEYHPQSGLYGALPDSWRFDGRDWPIIDGDMHDIRLRRVDGAGVIVGLRFKGSRKRIAQAIRSGFVFAT